MSLWFLLVSCRWSTSPKRDTDFPHKQAQVQPLIIPVLTWVSFENWVQTHSSLPLSSGACSGPCITQRSQWSLPSTPAAFSLPDAVLKNSYHSKIWIFNMNVWIFQFLLRNVWVCQHWTSLALKAGCTHGSCSHECLGLTPVNTGVTEPQNAEFHSGLPGKWEMTDRKQTCIHFQRECPATHWVLLSLNTLFPKRGQQYLQKPVFTYSCSPRTRTLLVMSGCCNDSPVINNATLLPGFSRGETLGRRHR